MDTEIRFSNSGRTGPEISDLARECISHALNDAHRAEGAYGDIPAVKDSWKSLAQSLSRTFTFDDVEHVWGEKPNCWGFATSYISVFCAAHPVSREKIAKQLQEKYGADPSELTDNMPDVYIWSLNS